MPWHVAYTWRQARRGGANLVAPVNVAVANGEKGRRAVAQRDDELVVGRRPFQDRAHIPAPGDVDQRAVTTGNEDGGVVVQTLGNNR